MSLEFIDHLVLATPDLEGSVKDVGEFLGCKPTAGGRHIGMGTANYLVCLGRKTYLEIIGPDADQRAPERARPFGIDDLKSPRLVNWAVTVSDLDAVHERARRDGYDPGTILDMARETPEGKLLEWRLTLTPMNGVVGVAPFLIEWSHTSGPASDLNQDCELVGFDIFHNEPRRIERELKAIGVTYDVAKGEPHLNAWIKTPGGVVTLT